MDCSCERCQNFCRHKPGWFTPDQIVPLSRKLNLSVGELFQKFLRVDAVLMEEAGERKALYVLAPAMEGQRAGTIADPTAHGACVWLKDGACAIHEAKPRECSLVDHRTTPQEGNMLRAAILKSWVPHKKFIQDLYGKKLKPPESLKESYRQARRERHAHRDAS